MTRGDIFWMFFVVSALQPVLKQQFLDCEESPTAGPVRHSGGIPRLAGPVSTARSSSTGGRVLTGAQTL